MWHGTGWYYNDLSQIGIAFLLSDTTEKTWEQYKAKVLQGKLKDEDILWH